jgi:hypothetical protein
MLMDAGLIVVLIVAGLLIGATGTWSPCGFSMVETIGPGGHSGGMRTTIAACITFLPGAVAGALFTFGGLALAGALIHGAGGDLSYAVAAALAVVAAVAEARGARIAPQIRRQLPEHWRRVMPMPVASALYGGLLGLGFTTFVLSFGVWALAGIALALGEPAAGLAIGLGFGIGRATPIVVLAPLAERPIGRKALTLMAERPGIYRGIRFGDAGALMAAAVALAVVPAADAGSGGIRKAADPSVDAGSLAFQRGPGARAVLQAGGGPKRVPGTNPAVGGPYIATIRGNDIRIFNRRNLEQVGTVTAEGVDAVAISASTLAYRTRINSRDRIHTRALKNPESPGKARSIATIAPPSQISRPSLDGGRLAFAIATTHRSRIVIARVGDGGKREVLASNRSGLWNPSIKGDALLYVRATRKRDQLRLRGLGKGKGDRRLMSRTKQRMWTTALSSERAYVTILGGGAPRVVSVGR